MSIALRILSNILLLFNGIGAFYGSVKFITDPSGASLGMTVSLLEHSPFPNYFNSRNHSLDCKRHLEFCCYRSNSFERKYLSISDNCRRLYPVFMDSYSGYYAAKCSRFTYYTLDCCSFTNIIWNCTEPKDAPQKIT